MNGLVVIPVYNEAANLPTVIRALRDGVPAVELLFVDDGSADDSAAVLAAAGVPYVRHPINLGYAEALRTGMYEALRTGAAFVAFFDADGQHRVPDLRAVLAAYAEGNWDVVVGSRYVNGVTGPPTPRRLGTALFSRLTSLVAGIRVTDVTCGLKLIARPFIPATLAIPAEDLHAEFVVGVVRRGARVREIAITVEERDAGESMYTPMKLICYPARTCLCLLAAWLATHGDAAPPAAKGEQE